MRGRARLRFYPPIFVTIGAWQLRSIGVTRYCLAGYFMKLDNWVRFTWDVMTLPPLHAVLPEHYEITPATSEDEKEFRRVILSSFTLDPAWNPSIQEVIPTVESWLDRAFEGEGTTLLSLRHGARMIGAAVIWTSEETDNHFSPGPCVLMEYRNRGFGTGLLLRSLAALRDSGCRKASAITTENSPASKFLYSKLASIATPYEFTPLVAV